MSGYKRIVVGVDFSVASKAAADLAMHVARASGAEIMLLHVGYVPDLPSGLADAVSNTASEYRRIAEASLDEDRSQLAEWRERYHGQGVDVCHMAVEGAPDKAICEVADDWEANLICVGTRGLKGVARFVLGSVAERVVRGAQKDVMVVKEQEHDTDEQGGFRRILVGTDFSESSLQTLQAARQFAAEGATVELIHCIEEPSFGQRLSELGRQSIIQELEDNVREVMQERGHAFVEAHCADMTEVSFRLVSGDPKEVLAKYAEEKSFDLVALSTRSRKGVKGFLLGSVAESTVRHSPSSVLISKQPPRLEEEKPS